MASQRAHGTRVRKATSHPGFELQLLPNSPIRKPIRKTRRDALPLLSVADAVVDVDEVELSEVMNLLAPAFDAAVQPEGPLLPRFATPTKSVRDCWSEEEDKRLSKLVADIGPRRWTTIAGCIPGRSGKQCRERWYNHVDPCICKDPWTRTEDVMIQMGVSQFGHKWSEIALLLPGRTDSAVKNRYNSTIHGKRMREKDDNPTMNDEDLLRELKRRNALKEASTKPGKFSTNAVRELHREDPPQAWGSHGCRWTRDEHACLTHAMPKHKSIKAVDWAAVARHVPNRSAWACRKYWERQPRWGSPVPMREPELQPEESAPDVLDALDVLRDYAEDTDMQLMACEEFSEGHGETWKRSCTLVVGKPGLSFQFPPPGASSPPPLPAPPAPPAPRRGLRAPTLEGCYTACTARRYWLEQQGKGEAPKKMDTFFQEVKRREEAGKLQEEVATLATSVFA